MALQKTEAIILRRRHFGDTSLIFTFYTRDHGKIEALAKGVKMRISRGEGGLEILSQVELIYYEKEARTLRLVNHCYPLDSFAVLRGDLIKFAYASYLVEMVDRLVHGEEKNENIYELLLAALKRLKTETEIKRLVHFVEIKLITFLGYGPYLTNCNQCHKKDLGPHPLFTPASGGVICSSCHRKRKEEGIIIHKISLLQFLEKADFETLSRLKISEVDEKELKTVLRSYLQTLLGYKPLRTLKVISSLFPCLT